MNLSAWVRNRILHYCEIKEITVNKLASLSGLRQSTLQDVIAGKNKNPRIDTVAQICLGLSITLADFFQGVEEEIDMEK